MLKLDSSLKRRHSHKMQKRHVVTIGSVCGVRKKDLRIGFGELDSWFIGEKSRVTAPTLFVL